MTGNSDLRERLGAVFFAFIMVTSMVAVGMAGFAGSAAADEVNGPVDTNADSGVSPTETVNITNVENGTGTPNEAGGVFTAVNVSGANSVFTAENVTNVTILNSTGGREVYGFNNSIVNGETNVTFNVDSDGKSDPVGSLDDGNDVPFLYDVVIEFSSGALINGTSPSIQANAYNATVNGGRTSSPGFEGKATSQTLDEGVNVGNVSVQNFQQFGNDERTNFNLSVTTPKDSGIGVDESSISIALNNSDTGVNETNITVIENGSIVTSVAQDNGTNTDINGNVTYDIDVALPEEQVARGSGGYNVMLLGNVTDDEGNIIERVDGAVKSVTRGAEPTTGTPAGGGGTAAGGNGTIVNMSSDALRLTTDDNQFANTDAGTASDTPSADEKAIVNVTVVDRFGNALTNTTYPAAGQSYQDNMNATVGFSGTPTGVNITNISAEDRYGDVTGVADGGSGRVATGARSTPFQYEVSASFAGDIELTATDTDSSDDSLASDTATQTFTNPVEGVTLSTNQTSLPADGSVAGISAQLTDSNGNAIGVPGISVTFNNDGGFSNAGVSLRSSSATTNSAGVATVNLTADTSGESFTVRGTENKNNNADTIQINTTSGKVNNGATKFLFNGTNVSNNPGTTDRVHTNAVQVGTSHDVSVLVQDASSNPIEGASVEYTLDGSTVSTVTSDSNGYANDTITLPNQRVTNAQLNASVGTFNASAQSVHGNAQVNISTNATAATELQFVTSARALPIDSQSDVEVKVVDEFGNTNESVDQSITLTSDDASVMNFSGNAQSASQNLNDNNGVVTFTVDTASSAGTATLTASTSGLSNLSDTFSVNEPASIEVTFDNDVSTSSSASAKGIANLSAQLKGPSGSDLAVSGTTINFATVSGSAAELNQSGENFQNSTNSNGVATIQVNATSETGTTTFRALADNGASGTGTITTTGARSAIQLTPASSSVAENNSVNVTASFVDSEGRVVPRTDSITLTTSTGSLDSNSKSTSFGSDGTANVVFNYTADGNTGEVTLDAVGGGVTGSTTVTVSGQADTGSPLGGTAGEYDGDGDGKVTASELGNAVTAFGEGDLTASELGDVVTAFGQS